VNRSGRLLPDSQHRGRFVEVDLAEAQAIPRKSCDRWPSLGPQIGRGRSERGGLVVDVEEAHDFAIVDPKVVRQDQSFRKVNFVVVAIVETVHDDQRSHGPKAHPKR
jgi:hypothetical protein